MEANILLLGLLALILVLYALREMGRSPPARVAALTRSALAMMALGAAALALTRGHFIVALALGGAAMLTAAGKNFRAPFTFGGAKRVRGGTVDLEFDDYGVRDGKVLSGRFAGWKLSEMSKFECDAFHAQCAVEDPQALLALEAYLDRRFPGWRATAQDNADAGWNGSNGRVGEMSEQEAYQTLGLRRGSSADEIVRAHRALMKERHPDHGGTTDDAARLNQAKDRLLRRHV
ncbi:hypothetical protein CCR94_15385 [Rhodoblastus sphagnicola]|uniref:Uncharacterized protein n=1 Tax=Rhodoblastus sphagnicola TaxID=333368 RepID=A0A2S6N454_9HYPH|nr:molecular chaperone DnaJ [Rhodoblastus sphagnicola]MBB4196546.1 hypothetical protein [Rhodoblastus sphagnicola]PPQ29379.1 hypothetical protein CCR94_15385 [Rhodoblastus sphagnicola]